MPNARVTGLWLLLVSTCVGCSVPRRRRAGTASTRSRTTAAAATVRGSRCSPRRARETRPGELRARGDLADQRAAEVAVALEATADVDGDLLGDLALDAGVDADVVARAIDLVARLKAGEHLRAGQLRLRRRAERRVAEAVRRLVAAPRSGSARREARCRARATSDFTASVSSLRSEVEVRDGLRRTPSVPASNVVGLDVPSDALTEFSMLNWNELCAVREARVDVPRALAADAERDRAVVDDRVDLREKAVRDRTRARSATSCFGNR